MHVELTLRAPCFRYHVLISGKTAIHEALIRKSADFADRPEFYSQSLLNPDAKGYFMTMLVECRT